MTRAGSTKLFSIPITFHFAPSVHCILILCQSAKPLGATRHCVIYVKGTITQRISPAPQAESQAVFVLLNSKQDSYQIPLMACGIFAKVHTM